MKNFEPLNSSFEEVWNRIIKFEGEKFSTIRNLPFSYTIIDNVLITDRTDFPLAKSEFEKAASVGPLNGPGQINHLVRGPSYIYAILTDSRINGELTNTNHSEGFSEILNITNNSYSMIEEKSKNIGISSKQEVEIKPIKHHSSEVLLLTDYAFIRTLFTIYEKDLPSPFLEYKRHTVDNLLKKKHYSSLRSTIEKKYPQFLDMNIQSFMKFLVQNNDQFYRRFLNKNGSDDFCHYGLTDESVFYKRGLYLYQYEGEVVYIGRCRDNFHSRFNINYGKIYPINCYKEGQATNTRMNSLMNKYGEKIKIFLCPLTNDEEICASEKVLINRFKPEWNLSR